MNWERVKCIKCSHRSDEHKKTKGRHDEPKHCAGFDEVNHSYRWCDCTSKPAEVIYDFFEARITALEAGSTAAAECHDRTAPKCAICLECIPCNLRPCKDGQDHVPM